MSNAHNDYTVYVYHTHKVVKLTLKKKKGKPSPEGGAIIQKTKEKFKVLQSRGWVKGRAGRPRNLLKKGAPELYSFSITITESFCCGLDRIITLKHSRTRRLTPHHAGTVSIMIQTSVSLFTDEVNAEQAIGR